MSIHLQSTGAILQKRRPKFDERKPYARPTFWKEWKSEHQLIAYNWICNMSGHYYHICSKSRGKDNSKTPQILRPSTYRIHINYFYLFPSIAEYQYEDLLSFKIDCEELVYESHLLVDKDYCVTILLYYVIRNW